ncbi:hypothetical protein LGH70_19655 [Hymenobacter sp. BT635]|uniref:Uncharacterized protein n=1 Tax=Hymenobacter nitidus TaxID=2880929 RepID=A0ABS8AIK0_9BACT|nr:hypothetical protein [Hymenobacter nitidus]MCB2379822.1 hypothetical protein [Hymenobacter nitidus]
MINLLTSPPWRIVQSADQTIPLATYRHLEKQYVESFFATGALRLSSVKRFSTHTDEVRGDNQEHSAMYMSNYRPEEGEGAGHAIVFGIKATEKAFILCTTQTPSNEQTFEGCDYDASFRINDPLRFAIEVGKVLATFRGGLLGPCLYREPPILTLDLGKFNTVDLSPSQLQEKVDQAQRLIADDHEILFLKRKHFENQTEYRMIWFVDNEEEYIDIFCPEAVRFCERLT